MIISECILNIYYNFCNKIRKNVELERKDTLKYKDA